MLAAVHAEDVDLVATPRGRQRTAARAEDPVGRFELPIEGWERLADTREQALQPQQCEHDRVLNDCACPLELSGATVIRGADPDRRARGLPSRA